jgi:hypothetical protein
MRPRFASTLSLLQTEGAANVAVREFADRPPNPSPPRADARGGRGEGEALSVMARSAATKQSILSLHRKMDCFACARNDGHTHLCIPAARCARGLLKSLPLSKQRAQGKPGVRCTRSRACSVGSTRVSHHEFTGNIRLSPRSGFNGFLRALPGDRACLPPSPADHSANLTPASGCQDHTTSPSAKVSFARTLSCTDTVASTASRTQRP